MFGKGLLLRGSPREGALLYRHEKGSQEGSPVSFHEDVSSIEISLPFLAGRHPIMPKAFVLFLPNDGGPRPPKNLMQPCTKQSSVIFPGPRFRMGSFVPHQYRPRHDPPQKPGVIKVTSKTLYRSKCPREHVSAFFLTSLTFSNQPFSNKSAFLSRKSIISLALLSTFSWMASFSFRALK